MVSLTACNFILHCRQNKKGKDGLSNNMHILYRHEKGNFILDIVDKTRKVKMVSLTTCNFILRCRQNEKVEDGLSNNMQFQHSRQNEKGKDGLSNNMQFHLRLSTKRER